MRQIGVPYRLIRDSTAEIEQSDLPVQIDLLHIDGDHSATSVEFDCCVLFPRLRRGGVACFHDYRPGFAVVEVVDRLCAKWHLAATFGSMKAFVKP